MRILCGTMLMLVGSLTLGDTSDQRENSNINAVAEVFNANNVDGTLVVASAEGEVLHVFNEERSKARFSPASTFKILNTLVALDSAVVNSKESLFVWAGTDRGRAAWNKNQTLESAFKVSCVWCYQEVARKVGTDRYTSALVEVNYGNKRLGDQIDQFWLNGELQISAIEQISFLRNIFAYSTRYRREHVDILKGIMLDGQQSDHALHAKSGWTGPKLHIGWYVGFIEKGDDIWLFAMNMRMDRAEQAPLRKQLTIESLQALGVL